METCCFCWDIRSGTIASAVFVLITRTFVIILFSVILGLRQKTPYDDFISYDHAPYDYETNRDLPWWYKIEFTNIRLVTSIAVSCFHVVFSTLLLIGVKQKKKSLFLPWIILLGLEIFAGLCFIVMTFIITGWNHAVSKVAPVLIGISLQCYMLSCVTYYYKRLAARENSSTVYSILPLCNSNIPQEMTNTTTPNYNNAGWHYNTPNLFLDQPPKYEVKPESYNSMPLEDNPPPYDSIKRNEN